MPCVRPENGARRASSRRELLFHNKVTILQLFFHWNKNSGFRPELYQIDPFFGATMFRGRWRRRLARLPSTGLPISLETIGKPPERPFPTANRLFSHLRMGHRPASTRPTRRSPSLSRQDSRWRNHDPRAEIRPNPSVPLDGFMAPQQLLIEFTNL